MTFPAEEYARHVAGNLLDLTLMPTEQCNFRCTYCYEDFEISRMSDGLVQAIKRFLTRRVGDLDHLSLAWFGGEPLLASDIVKEIQAFAQSLAEAHPRLRLRASMTTNGYRLSRERFERLLALGITRYQVSLDGPREEHDRRRRKAGGQGTFDRIWSNLEAARTVADDFEILLRLHVDRDNWASMPAFLKQLAQTFGGDRRFRVFIRPVSHLGGPNDEAIPVLASTAGRTTIEKLRRLAQDLGLPQHEPSRTDAVCYAAAANAFVLRANGDLAKCTVALSHPNNHVGRILADGRLKLEGAKMEGWTRGLWSFDAAALHCPMRGYADTVSRPSPSGLVQLGGRVAPGRTEERRRAVLDGVVQRGARELATAAR